MMGLDPDIRFDKHKGRIQSNAPSQRYGMHFMPDLYEAHNPMGYKAATDMVIELDFSLRETGFGV
jgi:hypothetical protein